MYESHFIQRSIYSLFMSHDKTFPIYTINVTKTL